MPNRPTIALLHGVQSSRSTWWRLEEDLTDSGFSVTALDLLGHGARANSGDSTLTIADLADDVAVQLAGPVDLLVGHSLGAIVALTLAARGSGACRGVVLEDPPSPVGEVDFLALADEIVAESRAARADPDGVALATLFEHPAWSPIDAANAVENRRVLDDDRAARLIRTAEWDLLGLIAACPVPVQVLAATPPGSAIAAADRAALLGTLPDGRVSVIRSGHGVHRDRPALWLRAVLDFASAIGVATG